MTRADSPAPSWEVLLTASAEADFLEIVRWTAEQFGSPQARTYAETLATAVAALAHGPDIVGTKTRDEILKGLRSMHVARNGLKGRHLVIFRVDDNRARQRIVVLRLLHEAMDLPRHLQTAATRD